MKSEYPIPVREVILGIDNTGLIRKQSLEPDYPYDWDISTQEVPSDAGNSLNTEWLDRFTNYDALLELQPFKDTVLIHPGAGSANSSEMAAKIAKYGGAIGIVAVELYDRTVWNVAAGAKWEMDEHDIPYAVVQEDMLGFFRRLPDKSVSVLSCGLDKHILNWDYANQCATECERVVGKSYLRHCRTIIEPKFPEGKLTTLDEEVDDKFYLTEL